MPVSTADFASQDQSFAPIVGRISITEKKPRAHLIQRTLPQNVTREWLRELLDSPERLQRHELRALSHYASQKCTSLVALSQSSQILPSEVVELIEYLQEKTNINLPNVTKSAKFDSLLKSFCSNNCSSFPLEKLSDLWQATLLLILEIHFPADVKFKRDMFVGQAKTCPMDEVYQRGEKLGQGQFGVVIKVKDRRTHQIRCCKVVAKNQMKPSLSVEQIVIEIKALRQLDHPNIVKLYESFEDEDNLYLVFELIEGCDLLQVLLRLGKEGKSFTERQSRRIIRSITGAISHCHSKNVMHKDLAPGNIMVVVDKETVFTPASEINAAPETQKKGVKLPSRDIIENLDESNIKVIDFGLSEIFQVGRMSAIEAGTPYYMAPEVFKRRFDCKCDIWSVGVVLYLLITGHLPFDAKSKTAFIQLISTSSPSFPTSLFGHCSKECVNLLKQMLDRDASKRPSATEVLAHPWFSNQGSVLDPVARAEQHQEQKLPSSQQQPRVQSSKGKRASFSMFAKNPLRHVTNRGSVFISFSEVSSLKRVCMNLVAMQLTSDAIKEAPQVFNALDQDHDGFLSGLELSKALLNLGVQASKVVKIVDAIDLEGNGAIGYTAFVAAMLDIKDATVESNLWNAFRQLDLDNDGVITRRDVMELTRIGGIFGIDQQVTPERLLAEFDAGANGQITFQKFCTFLKN
eukprot:TRINITY_DN167098_c0_g1_i1.p1 TRINITY_DN167098_c0_g1~~TRINITY_DN167098_c0_g1_i1.p1  ORF type:complete len:689 (+),score=112.14 TRINITY_DN167098_c0_g1_i1:119-2185(+)